VAVGVAVTEPAATAGELIGNVAWPALADGLTDEPVRGGGVEEQPLNATATAAQRRSFRASTLLVTHLLAES
jgi:hypothetical protein